MAVVAGGGVLGFGAGLAGGVHGEVTQMKREGFTSTDILTRGLVRMAIVGGGVGSFGAAAGMATTALLPAILPVAVGVVCCQAFLE
jgi:hypothetical protein